MQCCQPRGRVKPARTEAPARSARSMATSLAFHVGDRSSCSASSCSSSTTIALMPAHGDQIALRPPMTTSTPPAARAH